MYPKVKVPDQGRDDEEEAVYYKRGDSCPNSNDLQTCFSGHQEDENSQIFVAKIPKIYVPSVVTSPICMSEEMGKHHRAFDGEVKPNTKASPILRPRAVISSPDNDAMIGNINRNKERKGSKALKSHDHIPNRHSQRKQIHTGGHSSDTEKTKDASPRVKIGHTASKGSVMTLSTERGNSRGSKTKVGKRIDP